MCLVHDSREFRRNEGSSITIGKTDDSNILWYSESFFLDSIKGGIGDYVVKGEDGIRSVLLFEETEGSVSGHIEIDSVANHEVAVDRDAVLSQSLQITVLSAAHHIKMVWTADEGDAARTGIYHVLGSLLGCNITIAYYLRELIFQTATGKEHQWNAHLVQLLEVRIVNRILCQAGDDAFHMHIQEVFYRSLLVLCILVTIGADYRVAIPYGIIFNAIQHGSIIMGHQVWHNHTNHPRCFFSEALCKRVWAIIELLGKAFHLLSHLLSHFMAVAQGSRHCCDADAKSVGEVFQRCSSLFHIQFMLIIDIQICIHIFCIFSSFRLQR